MALLLAVIAMACLAHTVEHEALMGADHHEDGDAAGQTVELVVMAFAAAFSAAASAGVCLAPRSWPQLPALLARSAPKRDIQPRARAGPIVLGVLRT